MLSKIRRPPASWIWTPRIIGGQEGSCSTRSTDDALAYIDSRLGHPSLEVVAGLAVLNPLE